MYAFISGEKIDVREPFTDNKISIEEISHLDI